MSTPQLDAKRAAASLTESQLLFWFSQKLKPDQQLYYDRVCIVLRVDGPLDVPRFERAFAALVRSCDSLRTRIHEVDGAPVAEVSEQSVPLEVRDSSTDPGAERSLREQVRRLGLLPLADGTPAALLAKLSDQRFAFCLSVHHLLTDAWSTRLIIQQLDACYLADGGAPELTPFAAFVDHCTAYRASLRHQKSQVYWREKLAEPAARLRFFRGDASAPPSSTFRVSRKLGREQSAGLRRLAESAGVFSPAIYFQALLFAYVARVSGQGRLRMGVPFANRDSSFQRVCGLLMNPCVMEVAVPGETFASLSRKLQREYLETGRHALFPVRNPGGERSYELYFNFQNVAYPTFASHPAQFELWHSGASNDALALQVHDFDGDGCYDLDFDFSRRHFDELQGEAAAGHYLNLLEALLADPHTPIDVAPLLSEGEQNQVLRDFNCTSRSYVGGCLDQHIWARAAAAPERTAVIWDGRSFSYGELTERAEQLAHRLSRLGAGPRQLVAVLAERSVELVVALLATLRAGAAYVPVDPAYPDDRIRALLERCGPAVVLTGATHRGRPALDAWCVVSLDDPCEPELAPAGGPATHTEADAAYVIFTSGSTGEPKGVVITHAAINNRLQWMQAAYPLQSAERVLQKTPFTFDVSVWEFFWPLMFGATLVVLPPERHRDASYLARFIAAHEVSVLHFVPSMLAPFLEVAAEGSCPSIRRTFCSGEALGFELAARFHRRFPRASLHNLYGPTEAAVDVSFHDCRPEDVRRFVPIGRPISNVRLHILDRSMQPVPLGAAGEVHIGGVGLAREYLGRPDLTLQRFLAVPESLDPGGRLYKTGDIGRFDADGSIEYLGRADQQIKLRGFRIELGEIEAVCQRFPAVQFAAVDLRRGGTPEAFLAAYLVAVEGHELDTGALRRFLEKTLPEYMVPSLLVALPELPLTSSGKLDRKRLPELNELRAEHPGAVDAMNGVEEQLAEMWKSALGLDRVGLTENFFELGGHSLLALEIITRIQRSFRCEIPLSQFFEKKATIQNLAHAIQSLT